MGPQINKIVLNMGLGLDGNDSKILKSLRGKKSENLYMFIIYLKNFGYNMEYTNSRELRKIIKIFQMRFRPELIDGKLDAECYEIAKSLYNLK